MSGSHAAFQKSDSEKHRAEHNRKTGRIEYSRNTTPAITSPVLHYADRCTLK